MPTIGQRLGVLVTDIATPGRMSSENEQAVLLAFEYLCSAAREYVDLGIPATYSAGEMTRSISVQASTRGFVIELARMLFWKDRYSPLTPSTLHQIPPHVFKSSQALLNMLRLWFVDLPPITMSDEAWKSFFKAVKAADRGSDLSSALRDMASRTDLTPADCEKRVLFYANEVLPEWQRWLGGVRLTALPRI